MLLTGGVDVISVNLSSGGNTNYGCVACPGSALKLVAIPLVAMNPERRIAVNVAIISDSLTGGVDPGHGDVAVIAG